MLEIRHDLTTNTYLVVCECGWQSKDTSSADDAMSWAIDHLCEEKKDARSNKR